MKFIPLDKIKVNERWPQGIIATLVYNQKQIIKWIKGHNCDKCNYCQDIARPVKYCDYCLPEPNKTISVEDVKNPRCPKCGNELLVTEQI